MNQDTQEPHEQKLPKVLPGYIVPGRTAMERWTKTGGR